LWSKAFRLQLNAKNEQHLRERYNLAANLKHTFWRWPVRKRLKGEVGGPFRLLAEKMVELKIVPSVSPMTVCNTLKKMNLSLTKANTGRYRRTKTQDL
jgi:hypothetical protein